MMKFIGLFWLNILCFNQVFTADIETCKYGKCGDCISSTEDCVWCSDEDITTERCRPASYINDTTKHWCKGGLIEYSKDETIIVKNDNFTAGENGTAIQFKPQHISFTGRPGQSMPIQMSYKPAKDYPLDVYYLMDNSYTMISQLQALKEQAAQIFNVLTNLTNNVRLGVGSFIEKPAFPYYDKNSGGKAYVFKNLVNLTDDTTAFNTAINHTDFGSNYDDPEAGLDALMQVMTCKDELGWRPKSRKFIVLCTDSTYHSAGDGKMIGIIKPNDMQCHFGDNRYTMELEYDYPSVSQINKIVTEGGFQVIFAVDKYAAEYNALANQIVGSKYAQLQQENITAVDIIKNSYLEAVSYLKLDHKLPDGVQLTLDPDCRKESKTNEGCRITHTEPIVNINGILTITSCPDVNEQKGVIGPIGLDDKLIIQINYNCKCKCEKEFGALSSKCNNAGFRQCGLCNCKAPSYGINCRCNGTSSDVIDYEKCKGEGHSKPCSGRGECKCGKCEKCDDGFSGSFCEFNDKACPYWNQKLCSENGNCKLGRCHCSDGWTGDDCSCPVDINDCIAPQSKKVCSGNGVCKCGACECNKVEGRNESYSGVFCDTCEECAEERCRELEDYASCNYLNNKEFCDQQHNATDVQEVNIVNKTEINGPAWYSAKWCKKQLDNGSYIVFKYKYNMTALILVIQNEHELPPKANIWIAVGSAIAAVLLIGLLTVVIWKILIDMHDAKEYEKFAKESAAAGFDVSNPLYESPATKFSNPAYTGDN